MVLRRVRSWNAALLPDRIQKCHSLHEKLYLPCAGLALGTSPVHENDVEVDTKTSQAKGLMLPDFCDSNHEKSFIPYFSIVALMQDSVKMINTNGKHLHCLLSVILVASTCDAAIRRFVSIWLAC